MGCTTATVIVHFDVASVLPVTIRLGGDGEKRGSEVRRVGIGKRGEGEGGGV